MDRFGRVPVLMELLMSDGEFKDGLGYDREFIEESGLDYAGLDRKDWDKIRAGAARYYSSSDVFRRKLGKVRRHNIFNLVVF